MVIWRNWRNPKPENEVELMITFSEIQIIGNEVAIRWSDGSESFYAMDYLRAVSPSAETQGEQDLFGNPMGPDQLDHDFTGVTVTGWKPVGSYGVQFHFSDGHKTGIYSFEYLQKLPQRSSE